jgi:hypothetical protein
MCSLGTLMLVDTEDGFRPEEVSKIQLDVRNGLSVMVLAEWYNEDVMRKIKFFDDNTQLWFVFFDDYAFFFSDDNTQLWWTPKTPKIKNNFFSTTIRSFVGPVGPPDCFAP